MVEHCGGVKTDGNFVHTLVLTDIATGWTECVAMPMRNQQLIREALEAAASNLPFIMLGIDTDNDSAFINQTIIDYCNERGVVQTRSRPYRKNDQAWVEQKNGAVVRRLVGYERFSGDQRGGAPRPSGSRSLGEAAALIIQVSSATIDRLLSETRRHVDGKRRRSGGVGVALRRSVPVRTFSDYGDPPLDRSFRLGPVGRTPRHGRYRQ
jgi:hypothetical protein